MSVQVQDRERLAYLAAEWAALELVELERPLGPLAYSNLLAECTPASGSRFGLGVTQVTCVAFDPSGNTNSCNFMVTIVDHNRTTSLPSIAEVFHEVREEAAGIVPAEITTASPLTGELKERTMRALEQMTGRKIRLTTHVDPEILGGAVTRVGSNVYDGCLKTQLDQLRRKMTQE